MQYKDVMGKMSLKEKVEFCSGADYWNTKAYPEHGIPSIRMNDGPYGLRIPKAGYKNFGIDESLPATCFPATCTTGASWDRELLRRMGGALGEEALQEGTAILLGPGVNIKRNPLCGRNFEYFSEDPYLAGELAAAWIKGVQSKGVGTSLKHYAGNNQENNRLRSDSIIDERALREIYLAAFEKAVKEAGPATVMCAYNMINGVYCSDNKYLLTDILRSEWGFEGAVMSDWGATNDRGEAFKAGLDLEMPGSKGFFTGAVLSSVEKGGLPEEYVDRSVERLLSLVFSAVNSKRENYKYDIEAHHGLAREIAANSAVLLKNENSILPLDKTKRVALIGNLAENLRYQGFGSAKITPHKVSNVIDGLKEAGVVFSYYEGYHGDTGDRGKFEEAVSGAGKCDIALIVAGLTEVYESEGFDRASMELPENQNRLIDSVAGVNPNVVVLLLGGAPVAMPWLGKVKAILNMYLPGQAGGQAAADILTGKVNPSGKLAETYPMKYEDVVCSDTYGINPRQAPYRESIYVGYRYYEKAGKKVLFPFGFGLSYTTFEYSGLKIKGNGPQQTSVELKIKNTGNRGGAEIVQLYVGKPVSGVFCPIKELKDFAKIYLEPGEEKELVFNLNDRAFSYYDAKRREWVIQEGRYSIRAGASSRDIRLEGGIAFENITGAGKAGTESGDCAAPAEASGWYQRLEGRPGQEEFEALLGRKIKPAGLPVSKGGYDLSCSMGDMLDSGIIKAIYKIAEIVVGIQNGGRDYSNPNFKMVMESFTGTPLKNLILMGDGLLTPGMAKGLVTAANGHVFKGILTWLKNPKNGN